MVVSLGTVEYYSRNIPETNLVIIHQVPMKN